MRDKYRQRFNAFRVKATKGRLRECTRHGFLQRLLPHRPTALGNTQGVTRRGKRAILRFLCLLPRIRRQDFCLAAINFKLQSAHLIHRAYDRRNSRNTCAFTPANNYFFKGTMLLIRCRRNMMRVNRVDCRQDIGNLFMLRTLGMRHFKATFNVNRLAGGVSFPAYQNGTKVNPQTFKVIRATSTALQDRRGQERMQGFNQRRHNFHLLSALPNKGRINITLRNLLSGQLWLQIHGGLTPKGKDSKNDIQYHGRARTVRALPVRVISVGSVNHSILQTLMFNVSTTANRCRTSSDWWCRLFLRCFFVLIAQWYAGIVLLSPSNLLSSLPRSTDHSSKQVKRSRTTPTAAKG